MFLSAVSMTSPYAFRVLHPPAYLCVHHQKAPMSSGIQFLLCKTSLDSILKSRDITLPTEVRLVKAMVFPVVMYGC